MRKILIIEDTDRKHDDLVSAILNFFCEFHETIGIERATSYMEALQTLRENYSGFEGHYKYDFVICDNIMPYNNRRNPEIGVYGSEIIKWIRNYDEDISIIACSSEKMDDFGQNYTLIYSVWNMSWRTELEKALMKIVKHPEKTSEVSETEKDKVTTRDFSNLQAHHSPIMIGNVKELNKSNSKKKWPPDNRRKKPKG